MFYVSVNAGLLTPDALEINEDSLTHSFIHSFSVILSDLVHATAGNIHVLDTIDVL